MDPGENNKFLTFHMKGLLRSNIPGFSLLPALHSFCKEESDYWRIWGKKLGMLTSALFSLFDICQPVQTYSYKTSQEDEKYSIGNSVNNTTITSYADRWWLHLPWWWVWWVLNINMCNTECQLYFKLKKKRILYLCSAI